ncbi:hypothetical protein GBA52_014015 [Prunus armeniaca]|nr:hypothetical protein GBA52_014015 [Prunus armeniaca]
MASDLLRVHTKTIKTAKQPNQFLLTKTLSFPSLPFPTHHHHQHISLPPIFLHKSKTSSFISPLCSLSSPTPPSSKEAAIQHAKTCLSTTLKSPLNNLKTHQQAQEAQAAQISYRNPGSSMTLLNPYPSSLSRPVVIFNPKWVCEDEAEFGELSALWVHLRSFFSLMGFGGSGAFEQKKVE